MKNGMSDGFHLYMKVQGLSLTKVLVAMQSSLLVRPDMGKKEPDWLNWLLMIEQMIVKIYVDTVWTV